ncbi:SDR family oxidoreductase [Pelomyxa schiedti]|nr:SDR family oxidoreductase [Pelomyxa schiedti]
MERNARQPLPESPAQRELTRKLREKSYKWLDVLKERGKTQMATSRISKDKEALSDTGIRAARRLKLQDQVGAQVQKQALLEDPLSWKPTPSPLLIGYVATKQLEYKPQESPEDEAKLDTGEDTTQRDSGKSTTAVAEESPSSDTNHQEHHPPIPLTTTLACYICKNKMKFAHGFYDQLCPECGKENFDKRSQTINLTGKVALVTGGRIKIGYEIVLKLLRAGASVVMTTRFPHDAVFRYSREPDFSEWRDKLQVHMLDMRMLREVEAFAEMLCTELPRLDILINNAAQTIRRPQGFFQNIIPIEQAPAPPPLISLLAPQRKAIETTSNALRIEEGDTELTNTAQYKASSTNRSSPHADEHSTTETSYSQYTEENTSPTSTQSSSTYDHQCTEADISSEAQSLIKPTRKAAESDLSNLDSDDDGFDKQPECFPQGEFDCDGQQVDLRRRNTWVKTLGEVCTVEAAEVHAINALAPFILCSRLKAKMAASSPAHIVNVSSMEGRFAGPKQPWHPHTNMAKAALNMMTRTSAEEFAQRGVYMNSVDTGWVTYEAPNEFMGHKLALGLEPPIDEIDGAARVLDPVFVGYKTGNHSSGNFYKDYKLCRW